MTCVRRGRNTSANLVVATAHHEMGICCKREARIRGQLSREKNGDLNETMDSALFYAARKMDVSMAKPTTSECPKLSGKTIAAPLSCVPAPKPLSAAKEGDAAVVGAVRF